MKTTIKMLLFVSMIALSIISCTKEGPIGPVGPAGSDRVDGTNGMDGADGSAEVLYSEWTAIEDWSTDLPDFKYERFPNLILTQD